MTFKRSALLLALLCGTLLQSLPAALAQYGGLGVVGEIKLSALPPEARETLELIKRKGPFPFQSDGSVFQNYDGRLLQRESGYYREFTVRTPNFPGRGERRIIVGARKEFFYTENRNRGYQLIRE